MASMALDMDSEPSTPTTQSSYFSGCMASPAWLPPGVRRSPARFQLLPRGGDDDAAAAGRGGGRRAWRGLIRRLVRESKSIVGSNACRAPAVAATFTYDADSYAKNFDDGRWHRHHPRAAAAAAGCPCPPPPSPLSSRRPVGHQSTGQS